MLLSVLSSVREKSNRHKLKHKRVHQTTRKQLIIFSSHCKGDQVLVNVVQRDCGTSLPRDTQKDWTEL